MIRSSLSGMAVMAMVSPDGAGPMRVPWRRRTPSGSSSSSNHQLADGFSGSETSQPERPARLVPGDERGRLPLARCARGGCARRSAADSAGPSSSHSAPRNSDENRAGSSMSVTSSQTRSIGACTSVSTSTVGPSAYFIAPSCIALNSS